VITIATLAGAFVFCYALLSILISLAPRWGLVDHPGGRKEHSRQTPLVGGLAIAMTLLFALITLRPSFAVPMLIAVCVLLAVGVADDLIEVEPIPKFAMQAAAGLVMYLMAQVELHFLGDLLGFGAIGLWWFSVPLTVFAVIGVINSMNMADGIDGHAGAIALVAFLAFAFVARESDLWNQYMMLLVLAGATAGFLFINMRSPLVVVARAFLGDAGSMLLGFLIAWFAIDLTQGIDRSLPPVCALWIVVLPLCDCVSLMIRRKKSGRGMFVADRQHLHHYLLNRGLGVGQASAVTAGLSVVAALIGIGGWKLGVPEWVMFAGFVLLFIGYHRFMGHAFKTMPQFSVMPESTSEMGQLSGKPKA